MTERCPPISQHIGSAGNLKALVDWIQLPMPPLRDLGDIKLRYVRAGIQFVRATRVRDLNAYSSSSRVPLGDTVCSTIANSRIRFPGLPNPQIMLESGVRRNSIILQGIVPHACLSEKDPEPRPRHVRLTILCLHLASKPRGLSEDT